MAPRPISELPRALDALDAIWDRMRSGQPVVALDYDGTLTPIVRRADDAHLDPGMRLVIEALVARVPVVVLSGRDRIDVAARVDVDRAWYAGSHGFDIAGPNGAFFELPDVAASQAPLDHAFHTLEATAADVPGAWVERKAHAVALHYREVDPAAVDALVVAVDALVDAGAPLRRSGGKMVAELRPDVDWDKGTALRFLLDDVIGVDDPVPLFVGDDLTDEDAFVEVAGRGVGCVVEGGDHRTSASYRLADPGEVRLLLSALVRTLDA